MKHTIISLDRDLQVLDPDGAYYYKGTADQWKVCVHSGSGYNVFDIKPEYQACLSQLQTEDGVSNETLTNFVEDQDDRKNSPIKHFICDSIDLIKRGRNDEDLFQYSTLDVLIDLSAVILAGLACINLVLASQLFNTVYAAIETMWGEELLISKNGTIKKTFDDKPSIGFAKNITAGLVSFGLYFLICSIAPAFFALPIAAVASISIIWAVCRAASAALNVVAGVESRPQQLNGKRSDFFDNSKQPSSHGNVSGQPQSPPPVVYSA